MDFVFVNGADQEYEERGEDPPVVRACAAWFESFIWEQNRAHIPQRYRVLLLDRREAGESGDPSEPDTPSSMALDVLAPRDHLAARTFDFVGRSTETSIGIAVAVAEPHRLRRLA